jgi:uncharacterized protein (TIGR00369 family)
MDTTVDDLPPGYSTFAYHDPFEELVGPLGLKREGTDISFAFRIRSHHLNTGDTVHGGMLMTFADFAVCLAAVWDQPDKKCVTVSLNCEFVSAGQEGEMVEARCEVIRRTGRLTFVRGTVFAGDRVLLTCSSILKRIPGGRVRGARRSSVDSPSPPG